VKRLLATIGAMVLVGGAHPAHAGTALALSYDEVLKAVLVGNPALLRAGLSVDSADGAMLAAKGTWDPMARGGLGLSSSTSEGFGQFGEQIETSSRSWWNLGATQRLPTGTTINLDYNWTKMEAAYELPDSGIEFESQDPFFVPALNLTLSQDVLQGNRMAVNLAAVRKARLAHNTAEARLLVQRQQSLEDGATAYWALYHQRNLVEIATQSLEAAQEVRRVVQAQVAEGTLAPAEQARVEAAVVQAESALVDATTGERQARDVLLVTIGERPGQRVSLTTAPAEPTRLDIDEDAAVQAALKHNPELQALVLIEAGSHDDVRDARHALLPSLTADVGYGLSGFEVGDSGGATSELFSAKLPSWNIGANINVPILNRADKGNLASTKAGAAQAELDRRAWERSIEQLVRTQVSTLEGASAQISLREANLRFTEQTLAAERALQDAGRAIQRDVLEAMKEVENARVLLVKARADYQLAILTLERLKGTL
jgi:outer membrane protein TolC